MLTDSCPQGHRCVQSTFWVTRQPYASGTVLYAHSHWSMLHKSAAPPTGGTLSVTLGLAHYQLAGFVNDRTFMHITGRCMRHKYAGLLLDAEPTCEAPSHVLCMRRVLRVFGSEVCLNWFQA